MFGSDMNGAKKTLHRYNILDSLIWPEKGFCLGCAVSYGDLSLGSYECDRLSSPVEWSSYHDLYPNASVFDPTRWNKVDTSFGPFLEIFYSFGTGRGLCPGKWFAILRMQASLLLCLREVDLILEKCPNFSLTGVSVTPEAESSVFWVHGARKSRSRQLSIMEEVCGEICSNIERPPILTY